MKEHVSTPALIILRGIPGSGKTSIAKGLVGTYGDDTVQLIDPDEVDTTSDDYRTFSRSLSAQGVDEKFHPYRYLHAAARQAIDASKIIIWNQAFVDFKSLIITIERLKDYAHEQGMSLPILVVNVTIDADVARQRVRTRALSDGRTIDDRVMERFIREYAPFDHSVYPSIVVDGTDSVALSVTSIRGAIDCR